MKTKISRKCQVVKPALSLSKGRKSFLPLHLIPYPSLHFALCIFLFCILPFGKAAAQGVAINTTGTAADASAMLDVTSTNAGLLIPRMTLAQRNAIATPATSLLVYQTDGTPGYYYYNGTAWVALFSNNTGWALTGNDISAASGSFLGTTSNNDLIFKTNNVEIARILANGNIKLNALGTSIIGANGGWFDIYHGTSDGFDNGATRIGGGGDVSIIRGAFATFYGNEHATFPGDLFLTPGSVSGGDVIINSGNVGIGTTNPDQNLTIVNSTSTVGGISFYEGSVLAGNSVGFIGDGGGVGKQGVLTLKDAGTSNVFISGGTGDNSYIKSGNVGIGTASPDEKLTVNGTTKSDLFKTGSYSENTTGTTTFDISGMAGGSYIVTVSVAGSVNEAMGVYLVLVGPSNQSATITILRDSYQFCCGGSVSLTVPGCCATVRASWTRSNAGGKKVTWTKLGEYY